MSTKRTTPHADYTTLKNRVDSAVPAWSGTGGTLASGISDSAGTITLSPGHTISATSNFHVIIDLEIIAISSRSGDVLTVASSGRGYEECYYPGVYPTDARSHSSGAPVWYLNWGTPGNFNENGFFAATLVASGDTAYVDIARAELARQATLLFAGDGNEAGSGFIYWGLNENRAWNVYWITSLDWIWSSLTTTEKATYAECMRLIAVAHLTDDVNGNGAKETPWTEIVQRQSASETALMGNQANAQVLSCLLASIVSYGEGNSDAATQYAAAKAKVDTFIVPACATGVSSGGAVTAEGSSYSQESINQTLQIFSLLDTAVAGTSYQAAKVQFAQNAVDYYLNVTLPGSSASATTTTASGSSAGTSITVASATGWSVGQLFRVQNTSISYESVITGISGTTFTVRDPLPENWSNKTISHIARIFTWGDALQGQDYQNQALGGPGYQSWAQIFTYLKTADSTRAAYLRYWVDNVAQIESADAFFVYPAKVIWNDDTISPTDYTGVMPTLWSTANSGSIGLSTGRSAWSSACTYVAFLVGSDFWDHNHKHNNSYYIARKGVELSAEINGYYDEEGFGTRFFTPDYNEVQLHLMPFVTARIHNTVEMNGHGPVGPYTFVSLGSTDFTHATLDRSEVTSGYLYQRGNASGQYASATWTGVGFGSNAAQTFIRDFFFLKAAEIVVFFDRLGYSGASTSPTTWYLQFTGDPTISTQRITSTYAGQTIIHDIVTPTGMTLTEYNQDTVYDPESVDGFGGTAPHFMVSAVSGSNTANEYSLHAIQLGDSGFSPLSATNRTNGGLHAVQLGTSYIIGAINAASPSLPYTYSYTGTPAQYLMGFAASTAYHVTVSGGTVTVDTATGSGDTMSSAKGVLAF